MIKKIVRPMLLAILATLLITMPVLAAYYALIQVITTTTAYDMLPIITVMDNDYLASHNYITSTGLDTRVQAAGYNIPHMLVGNKTLFASALPSGATANFNYLTGESALTGFCVLTGKDGYITIPDDATLELGDTFAIAIVGWIDTSSGANKNLVFKDAAFKLYISAAGSIKAEITGGSIVTAAGISTGAHTVVVLADAIDLLIYIDGVLEDDTALSGVGVPDNANSWTIMQNECIAYLEYFKIWQW